MKLNLSIDEIKTIIGKKIDDYIQINEDSIQLKSPDTGENILGNIAFKEITLDREAQKLGVLVKLQWDMDAKMDGDDTLNKLLSAAELKPTKAEMALSITELLENYGVKPPLNNIRGRGFSLSDKELNLELSL